MWDERLKNLKLKRCSPSKPFHLIDKTESDKFNYYMWKSCSLDYVSYSAPFKQTFKCWTIRINKLPIKTSSERAYELCSEMKIYTPRILAL